jgi:hypothetical protein
VDTNLVNKIFESQTVKGFEPTDKICHAIIRYLKDENPSYKGTGLAEYTIKELKQLDNSITARICLLRKLRNWHVEALDHCIKQYLDEIDPKYLEEAANHSSKISP